MLYGRRLRLFMLLILVLPPAGLAFFLSYYGVNEQLENLVPFYIEVEDFLMKRCGVEVHRILLILPTLFLLPPVTVYKLIMEEWPLYLGAAVALALLLFYLFMDRDASM